MNIFIEDLKIGDYFWVDYFNDFLRVEEILQNKNNDFAVTDTLGRTFYFMKKEQILIR